MIAVFKVVSDISHGDLNAQQLQNSARRKVKSKSKLTTAINSFQQLPYRSPILETDQSFCIIQAIRNSLTISQRTMIKMILDILSFYLSSFWH